MADTNNLYDLLEDKLAANETNVEVVKKAIKEKLKWCAGMANNPMMRTKAAAIQKALMALEKQIASDPSIIAQHAAAYKEIAKQKKLEREKIIRDKGNLYVNSAGQISEQHLRLLASETKLSEAEILQILGAKVKQKKVFKYKDSPVQELDAKIVKDICGYLQVLGCKDIYTFLQLPSDAPLADINRVLAKVYANVTANVNKTDPKLNATDQLLKACMPIFKTEEGRARYDKSFGNLAFMDIRTAIESMGKGGTKYLSPDEYKRLLDACTKKGIHKDKAEYLIYTTAEKAGIEIDEGAVGNMVPCRYCGALNEDSTRFCRSCGMPVKVVCPKCGTESAHDDYTCKKCSFSLIGMKDARMHIAMAQAALNGNNVDDAIKEIKIADKLWPNCPDLAPLIKEAKQKQDSLGEVLRRIKSLCSEKLYYTAAADISALPVGHILRKEIESAIANAETLIAKANALTDANARIDYYMQALSIAADCRVAQDKIELTPPTAPASISAVVRGTSIHVEWARLPYQFIEYAVVRKVGGAPSSIKDGELVSKGTRNNTYDDIQPEVGVSYYYAVYSKCGDVYSHRAVLTASPSMVVADVNPNTITLDIHETQIGFGFKLPNQAKAIEIYRDGSLVKTLMGSSYIDSGLKTDHSYTYKFVVVFADCTGRAVKSSGITQVLSPTAPPKPVHLMLDDRSDVAKLSWLRPPKGVLCIYESNRPFDILENNKVNVDNFNFTKVDITGTSYQLAKNFSGVKYFLPITIQGNIGVAGNQVRVVSLAKPSGVTFNRNDGCVLVNWSWNNIEAVRLQIQVDNNNPQNVDVKAPSSASYKVNVPKTAKAVRISIAAKIEVEKEVLLSEEIRQVFSLQSVKVNFQELESESLLGFIGRDNFSITIVSDSILPCDLHLLVAENLPPTDLVNYRAQAVISSNELKPGIPLKKSFKYSRQMKGKALHCRLIAANRSLASQVVIIPETRQLK